MPEDGQVPAGVAAVPPLLHPGAPKAHVSVVGWARPTTVSNNPPPDSAVTERVHDVNAAALKGRGFENASAIEKLTPVERNSAPVNDGDVEVVADDAE